MAVHSKQLATDSNVTNAAAIIYTVPTGKRTIVKCLVTLNRAAAGNVLAVEGLAGGVTLWTAKRYLTTAGAQGDCDTWQPWIVLNAGDQLRVSAGAAHLELVVSGAELTV